MIKKIKTYVAILIENNLKGYILLGAIFVAGVVLAIIFGAKTVGEEEIRLYFSDYIQNVKNSGTEPISTFNLSMKGYIQFALVMFVSAVTIIGIPLSLVYIFIRGFSFGTVMCCLFKAFNVRAILIVLCAVIPHYIIAMPLCMAFSMYSVKKTAGLLSGGISVKRNILIPFLISICFLCVISISALAQAYLEPLLITLILSQFV